MTRKDLPHTELKILLGRHTKPARKRHNQRCTALICPIGLDPLDVHHRLRTEHGGYKDEDQQKDKYQRIAK